MKTFASTISKVFYGTLIHSRSIKEIEYIKQGLLFIDDQGKIAKLVKDVAHDKVDASLEGVESEKVKKKRANMLPCHRDHDSFPSPTHTPFALSSPFPSCLPSLFYSLALSLPPCIIALVTLGVTIASLSLAHLFHSGLLGQR